MDPLFVRIAARYQKKKTLDTGTVVYEYTKRQVQLRNRQKARRLESLRSNIKSLQSQVKKDLSSDDPETKLTALAIGLIDATYERVGNEQSAKEGHFGVTGWTRGQVKFSGKKATISYVGKSGVRQSKTVTDAQLVLALKDACEGSEGEDGAIFGGPVRIDASKVNRYLKKFDITAKDLRGFHANREMKERLKRIRAEGPELPPGRKEKDKVLKDEFKKALEETAKAVGHEASTLRSQYLVPDLEPDFMADGRVDGKMTKKAREPGRPFEAAYDPDQTVAELMAGLGMLLVQGIVVTNAFFKTSEVKKYLQIRRTYHKQFAQACIDLADAIDEGLVGEALRPAANPLRNIATISPKQDRRALRMAARALRGLRRLRPGDISNIRILRLVRMATMLVRGAAQKEDPYLQMGALYSNFLKDLLKVKELPAPMRTLFRKALKYAKYAKPDENANPGAWFEMSPIVKDRIREAVARTEAEIKAVSAVYSEDPEGNRVKYQQLQDKLEKIQGAAGVNVNIINQEEREPLDKILRRESRLEPDGPTSFIVEKVSKYIKRLGLRDPSTGKERKTVTREVGKVLTLISKARTFDTIRRIVLEAIEQGVLGRYVTDDIDSYLQEATRNRAVRDGKKLMPLTWEPISVEDFQAAHDTGKVRFDPGTSEKERQEILGKVSRAISDLESVFGKGFCGKHMRKLDFSFQGASGMALASYFPWDNRNFWQPRVKFGEDYEGLLAHELSHYFEDLLSWQFSGEEPGNPAGITSYGVPKGGGDIFGNTGRPLDYYTEGKSEYSDRRRAQLSEKMPEFLEFVDAVLSTDDYQRWCDKIGSLDHVMHSAVQELTGMSPYNLPDDHPYKNALDAKYKSDLPPELIEAAEKKYAALMEGDTRKLTYYQSTTEVWARMCEQYVYNKLAQAGISNPWLTQLTYDIDVMDQFMDEATFDELMMPIMDRIFEKLGTFNIVEKRARLARRILARWRARG